MIPIWKLKAESSINTLMTQCIPGIPLTTDHMSAPGRGVDDEGWDVEVMEVSGGASSAMPPSTPVDLGPHDLELSLEVDWSRVSPQDLDMAGAVGFDPDEFLTSIVDLTPDPSPDTVPKDDDSLGEDSSGEDSDDYEAQRAANIAANNAKLRELGLVSSELAPPTKPRPRLYRKRKAGADSNLELRRPSTRLRDMYARGLIGNLREVEAGLALPALGSCFTRRKEVAPEEQGAAMAKEEELPEEGDWSLQRPIVCEPRSRSGRYAATPEIVRFVESVIRPVATKTKKIMKRMQRVVAYLHTKGVRLKPDQVTPLFLYRFLAMEAIGKLNGGEMPDIVEFLEGRVIDSGGLLKETGFYPESSLFAWTTEWALTLMIVDPDGLWGVMSDAAGKRIFTHHRDFRGFLVSIVVLGFPRLSMRAGRSTDHLFPNPTEAGDLYARDLYAYPAGANKQEAMVYQGRSKMNAHFQRNLDPPPIVSEAIKCLNAILSQT